MSQPSPSTAPTWTFLAVISVDKDDEVQCQCEGCGHRIYAAIHMVQLPDGEIQCWGSTCYTDKAGMANLKHLTPSYPGVNGRRLTDEEREKLQNNRDQLIAQFRTEHEAELQRKADEARQHQDEERKRAEEARQAAEARKAMADPVANFMKDFKEAPQQPPTTNYHSIPTRRTFAPLPAVDYTKPRSREPMDDPRYCRIREAKMMQWLAKGVDLTRPLHYNSFIDNCLHDYESGYSV